MSVAITDAGDDVPDIIGLRVGKLTVAKYLGRRGTRSLQYWECLCDCGGKTEVRRARLLGKEATNSTRGCGCGRGLYQHKKRPISERFWGLVDRRGDDECWPWKKSTNPKGYGQFNVGRGHATAKGIKGVCQLTNRVAFELAFGAIPSGLDVLHQCDNPPCCNPRHLFVGTKADNMHDKISKGRSKRQLTKEQVVEIRRLAAEGATVAELSTMFDRMPYSVDAVIRRRTWRRVA